MNDEKSHVPEPDHSATKTGNKRNPWEPDGKLRAELQQDFEKLNDYHKAAGDAFFNIVCASLMAVQIKLKVPRGQFKHTAEKMVPNISVRTLSNYRANGELYLSAEKASPITVAMLKKTGTAIDPELIKLENVKSVLVKQKLLTCFDLKSYAHAKVKELRERAEQTNTKKSKRVDLQTRVKNAWPHMTEVKKEAFIAWFDAFAKSTPVGKANPKAPQQSQPPKLDTAATPSSEVHSA